MLFILAFLSLGVAQAQTQAPNIHSTYDLEILGFRRTDQPTEAELKKAFRKASRLFHPDARAEQSSDSNFQILENAYGRLDRASKTSSGKSAPKNKPTFEAFIQDYRTRFAQAQSDAERLRVMDGLMGDYDHSLNIPDEIKFEFIRAYFKGKGYDAEAYLEVVNLLLVKDATPIFVEAMRLTTTAEQLIALVYDYYRRERLWIRGGYTPDAVLTAIVENLNRISPPFEIIAPLLLSSHFLTDLNLRLLSYTLSQVKTKAQLKSLYEPAFSAFHGFYAWWIIPIYRQALKRVHPLGLCSYFLYPTPIGP